MPEKEVPEGLVHEGPGGYSMTPKWVVKRAFKDVWLYDWLRAQYGGFEQTFPGIETIAREFEVSRSTVERTLRRLVKVGALEIKARYKDDGSQTTNLYVTKWFEPED
jgi:hypothetical protein